MSKKEAASVNRRQEIISAAIEVFAESGYYRTTTMQVAKQANISQPYIFRFFASKEELLLAALGVSWERVIEAFRRIAGTAPAEQLEQQLIEVYEQIMHEHRAEILLQMQAQTIHDEQIVKVMQAGFREIVSIVTAAFQKCGIANPEERTLLFLARGMLCNISMALNMPELMNK